MTIAVVLLNSQSNILLPFYWWADVELVLLTKLHFQETDLVVKDADTIGSV